MKSIVRLCVTVVCLDLVQKKILIVFEKQPEGNVINLPSGNVNPGENPLLAAVRELSEETAVCVRDTDLHFAGNTLFETTGDNYFTMVYACHKPADEFIGKFTADEDVYDSKWLSYEEINALRQMHRNGFIGDKIRMAFSCLEAHRDPANNSHTPWYQKETKK